MKKILVINAHPNAESFNHALVEAYVSGAEKAGAEVKTLTIAELQFNPSLQFGYQKRMELEPDLIHAQELILWAEHLVWVHPVWWGGLPAVSKGFIDRVFLPGFAFKYRENSVWWDKLLAGRTARIITTLDQPSFYYRLAFGRPSVNQLKKSTLQFCGIKPVKVTYIGPIRLSKEEFRQNMIQKITTLGEREGR
jgi:NAD(P)H dehydrogenase (quinone)